MDQCEHWRNRVIPDGTLADVYDGRIWKKFMNFEGRPFLSNPYNLGLMLNCDWFQPFDLSTYDFSGVDIGTLQTHDQHKKNAIQALSALTPSQRDNIETETGSRFTELMNLPYYDCIRYAIIDPMHNLMLGTPKRLFTKQWVNSGLLNKTALEEIQEIVNQCIVPKGIGRIPHKLSSNFARLTADEWKNWTLLFSPIALHNHLPPDDFNCWQLYVSACNIYCSSVLTLSDINRADELMKSFFVAAETLYGPSFLSINMHLHLHLQKFFKDYGPCYGYWLFSYERYNGILGNYHTNQLSIEIQLMRRFIENVHIRFLANPDMVGSEHFFIFKDLLGAKSVGSASDTIFGQTTFLTSNFTDLPSLQTGVNVTLLSPFVLYAFDGVSLRMCYQAFIPNVDILEVPQLCCKHRTAMWWFQYLKSVEHPAKVTTCILANWVGENGCITEDSSITSPGRIEYFLVRNYKLEMTSIILLKLICKMVSRTQCKKYFHETCRNLVRHVQAIWSSFFYSH